MTHQDFQAEYQYLGDRHTDGGSKGIYCMAVRRPNGKCIRGRNGNMLVEMECGRKMVVVARLLRKVKFGLTAHYKKTSAGFPTKV